MSGRYCGVCGKPHETGYAAALCQEKFHSDNHVAPFASCTYSNCVTARIILDHAAKQDQASGDSRS